MNFTIEHGSFAYTRRGAPVLDDISFSVAQGEAVAVLGPNGAGKTTLLRCAMGLLPWRSGHSLLDGTDIRRIPARRLWQTMAYVPQARESASDCTALELVLLGRGSRLSLLAQPGETDLAAAQDALARLGIAHLADRRCTRLSGGELQLVRIARALAAQPRLLILDEPEANLDLRSQLLILDTLSRLAQEGIACLFNTHYPGHALRRADRALLLDTAGHGTFGPAAEIITEEALARVYGVRTAIRSLETEAGPIQDVFSLSILDRQSE